MFSFFTIARIAFWVVILVLPKRKDTSNTSFIRAKVRRVARFTKLLSPENDTTVTIERANAAKSAPVKANEFRISRRILSFLFDIFVYDDLKANICRIASDFYDIVITFLEAFNA